MIYATLDEFILHVGEREAVEITNLDDPSESTVNQNKLIFALTTASREIDGYLANRYETPLTLIPGFIKQYCIDITWYRLAQNNAPEAYEKRYNNAIARLKEIEKGQLLLIADDGNRIQTRKVENQLVDERGNNLNDWTPSYIPGGGASFTEESLSLFQQQVRRW